MEVLRRATIFSCPLSRKSGNLPFVKHKPFPKNRRFKKKSKSKNAQQKQEVDNVNKLGNEPVGSHGLERMKRLAKFYPNIEPVWSTKQMWEDTKNWREGVHHMP